MNNYTLFAFTLVLCSSLQAMEKNAIHFLQKPQMKHVGHVMQQETFGQAVIAYIMPFIDKESKAIEELKKNKTAIVTFLSKKFDKTKEEVKEALAFNKNKKANYSSITIEQKYY